MTFLGKAVFGRELAQRRLALQHARTRAYFENDNPMLREVVSGFALVDFLPVEPPRTADL